ncbi:MAG: DUF1538 domain-containing protein, partial [Lachnospiraceae bacterium]|nr:DUF1538 domain-containing protein [Lachnospiraceae bacterium]
VSNVIDGGMLIICVGLGVGLFLAIAIMKIITHKPLSMFLMLFYMLMFALAAFLCEIGKNSFMPLAFDSGGVTTGPITVPFIMAFGVGIAGSIGGKDANENSFGLVSLCSVGPIIVVLLLSIMSTGNLNYEPASYSMRELIDNGFHVLLFEKCIEVSKALGILFLSFLIIQFFVLKLPFTKLRQITIGIIITFIGLVVFLSIVTLGFFPMGYAIGCQLSKAPSYVMIVFCFIIGMTVVLAEPAVQVLNRQVEDITAGTVTKKSMMIALSIGVGISLALSVVRQVYNFSILYYLIPGYFISLMLSLFVPPLYTSIAFDSGGVASGPMTSTFILPMMIGMTTSLRGSQSVLSLAFGVVALVAMTPLITIQILGFKAIMSSYIRNRIVMKRILTSDDEKIIYFEV